MGELCTKEYYIGYIDILGYKNELEHLGENVFLTKINDAIAHSIEKTNEGLFTEEVEKFETFIKVFSDNIVIGMIANEEYEEFFGEFLRAMNDVQMSMLNDGLLVRGSITKGSLYITERYIYGKGLIRAYELEDNVSIVPRIIMDIECLGKETVEEYRGFFSKDADGFWFIDYLREMNAAEFAKHKTLIEEGIKTAAKTSVLQKFLWCKEYHNRHCAELVEIFESCGSGSEEEQKKMEMQIED